MTDRRGSRFLLEVLFLAAVAVGVTLARLTALEIAGAMLLGWLIVALLEWAAWRNEPHYGSGLPPRYYVPRLDLPPAQPLEQVARGGYPEVSRDEAPTWIASAALRSEVLGDWPLAIPVPDAGPDEPADAPPEATGGEDAELDETGLDDTELEDGDRVALPPVLSLEEADDGGHEAVDEEPEGIEAPAVLSGPAGPGQVEPDQVEPVRLEPAGAEHIGAAPDAAPSDPAPADAAPLEEAVVDVVVIRTSRGTARYTLDPLAPPATRRRFLRGGGGAAPVVAAVDVPARPAGVRPLPGGGRER